ncbi:unnamed protein product [Urochloa decumbens]|uniref:Ubiquitin-like protease family profile domain-containing protein n=1 Tax=Urochloa decumbens TaxID=240449 RepID=A0ABC8WJI2_9POAL
MASSGDAGSETLLLGIPHTLDTWPPTGLVAMPPAVASKRRQEMARKRPVDFIDIGSSQESDDVAFGDGSEPPNVSQIDGLHGSENLYFGHPEESDHAAYEEVMKDYAAIKVLKRKLVLGLSRLGVKNFKCGKASKAYDGDIVAGCIYYLSVIYLDHVNFGSRQLPQSIPRIYVWKGSMIKQYSEFDLKSSGCYGSHPLIDSSHSCYSKDVRNFYSPTSSYLGSEFNDRLDEYAGCNLPGSLKVNICKLIESYCLNSSLSINMDVQCISALPDDMKITFCKLLQHACSIDLRSQKLVLDVMKLVSQSSNEDFFATSEDKAVSNEFDCIQQASTSRSPAASNEHHKLDDLENAFDSVICPQQGVHETIHSSDPDVLSTMHQNHASHPVLNDENADDANGSMRLPVPNLKRSVPKLCPKAINVDVARVMQKLNKSSPANVSTIAKKSFPSQNTLSGNLHTQTLNCSNPRGTMLITKEFHWMIYLMSFLPNGRRNTFSPASIPGRRRFIPDKDLLYLQKSYLSSMSSPTDISDHSNAMKSSSSQFNRQAESSHVQVPTQVSPEVQINGERNLPGIVHNKSKKSDALYNTKSGRSQGTISKPILVPENTPSCSRPLPSNPATSAPQKVRESTTVGKLSSFGARLLGQSVVLVGDHNVSKSVKYHVSKSEIVNYEAICGLAFSEYQGEDAVYLYGVRCTFWSLGESLKPHGQVHSFVVSVFCYSLFLKPVWHFDVSKRYYFFPNIADNLLKNYDEADEDVLSRAFKRLSKIRPVTHSNMLFFPSFYDEHWFVFVVDMKERKYVMLDSLYKEDDEYQQYVSQRMRASFQYYWQKILQVDIGFEDFQLIYPAVPRQPSGHENDSGIYAMMFLEHWLPNTSSLSSLFGPKDIPNIRIKIANDLVFQPKNSGMKNRVIEFHVQDD